MKLNKKITRLDQALADRFCLHGSPTMGLTWIDPKQATCRGNNRDHSQCAVYADPHGIRRPLIHATITKLCGGTRSSHGYEGDQDTLLTVTGTNVTFSFGSIYILKCDTFRFQGDEFISFVPVLVVAEIIVSPRTLLAIRHDYDLHITVPPPW